MLKRGDQIVYVPLEANGDSNHPACEAGFVTCISADLVFCRFWSKRRPNELRTKANSEACEIRDLVLKDTHTQLAVDEALKNYCQRE